MIAFRAGPIFAQGDYINKIFPRQVIITRVSMKSAHTHTLKRPMIHHCVRVFVRCK